MNYTFLLLYRYLDYGDDEWKGQTRTVLEGVRTYVGGEGVLAISAKLGILSVSYLDRNRHVLKGGMRNRMEYGTHRTEYEHVL